MAAKKPKMATAESVTRIFFEGRVRDFFGVPKEIWENISEDVMPEIEDVVRAYWQGELDNMQAEELNR